MIRKGLIMAIIDKDDSTETRKRIILFALAAVMLIGADVAIMAFLSPPLTYGGAVVEAADRTAAAVHQPQKEFSSALEGSSWESSTGSRLFISPKGTIDETSAEGDKSFHAYDVGMMSGSPERGFEGEWSIDGGPYTTFTVRVGDGMSLEAEAFGDGVLYDLVGGGGGSR